MADEKTYGTPIKEVEIGDIYYKVEASNGITEISDDKIRITNLETGVYKLTYAGTKYIYYNGSVSTLLHTVTGDSGAVILTVNKYQTGYWHWYYINGSTGYETIYYGYTTASSGSTGSKALNSLLTSHLYRPIQVNGTQILANSASTALNLSNDGNIDFTRVSGGKIKADITGLEVAKLFDFTVYNDSYTWGHLISDNGYTQLFSLDTANGSSIGLAEKDGQLSMQIDGDYYGNEGANRLVYDYETPKTCLDSSGTTPEVSLDNSYFNTNAYVGTVNPSSTEWHYVINVPHRGGNGSDGYLYDFQLATRLDINDSLRWRTKNNGSWSSWSEIPRVIPTTALTHIATIDTSTYYVNPRNLSFGTTYVIFSVFNSDHLKLGVYNDDSSDYDWYGTYGGITFVTFRQDWMIFVYNENSGRYTTLSMTDDFAIKSNYGPIEICQLKV